MARFYGAVGYITETEEGTDIIVNKPTERMYKGELMRNSHRLENGLGLNDNITINNQISILADPYANNNMHAIRYVRWRGTAWKITSVESQPPRLNLTLGGVYNGPIAE